MNDSAAYATVRIERPCCLCGAADLAGGSCDHCGDTRLVEVDVPCHELTAAEIHEIQRGGSPEARAAVNAYLALLRAEEAA